MKPISEIEKDTNKWLCNEPTKLEKSIEIVLLIIVAAIFMGAMMK